VQEVQNPDAGKGFRNDVHEDRTRGPQVHCWEPAIHVVELCQSVDDYKSIGCLEIALIPKDHPGCIESRCQNGVTVQSRELVRLLAMQKLPIAQNGV